MNVIKKLWLWLTRPRCALCKKLIMDDFDIIEVRMFKFMHLQTCFKDYGRFESKGHSHNNGCRCNK